MQYANSECGVICNNTGCRMWLQSESPRNHCNVTLIFTFHRFYRVLSTIGEGIKSQNVMIQNLLTKEIE